MKTQLSVRVKNPANPVETLVLESGLNCQIRQTENGLWRCFIPHASRPEKPYQVRVESAFRAPSLKTLEKWTADGIAKSIGGKKVEPDGHDENGLPSWMIVMGII